MMKIVLFKIVAGIITIIATIALLIATNSIRLLGFWDSTITLRGCIICTIAIILAYKTLNITGKIN